LNPEAWISGEQLVIISFFSFLQLFSFWMWLVCVLLLFFASGSLKFFSRATSAVVLSIISFPQLPLLILLVDSS
jgi:hypothetical protein